MARTIVQLTEKQMQRLRRRAKGEDVSVSELVRRGVDSLLATPIPDEDAIRKAKEAVGFADLGLRDLADRHDEYFARRVPWISTH